MNVFSLGKGGKKMIFAISRITEVLPTGVLRTRGISKEEGGLRQDDSPHPSRPDFEDNTANSKLVR